MNLLIAQMSSLRRGLESIEDSGIILDYGGVVIHDCGQMFIGAFDPAGVQACVETLSQPEVNVMTSGEPSIGMMVALTY